ncbi:MAG TPA: SGNH/GDSL hydrolase family protein [Candidatus Tumulicola sp.]|nr:SGNH/GDSL hydrolase family protein [Candidatus Tumulicola sp.]
MKFAPPSKTLALLTLAALAACGGGGGGSSLPAAPPPHQGGSGSGLLDRIVGVGDSLTAGYQSDGLLGATNVKDPLDPGTPIPPGQENGYWADVVEQASSQPLSAAIAQMYDPGTSPLPLIAGPGLNNQIVPSYNIPYFGFEKPGNACADDHGFNQSGYSLHGSARTRMNPVSTVIRNVSVPGITLHEANTLTQPQSMTCKVLPGIQGLLAQVVDGESSTFWPVLGNWSFMGQSLTMVNAAAQIKPTLAIVWLGANDVLKYMGSGGRFVGGDNSVAQVDGDLKMTIQTLRKAGAPSVVANLPNILQSPYFMRTDLPGSPLKLCPASSPPIQTYFVCVWTGIVSPGNFGPAEHIASKLAETYGLTTHGCIPASTTKPCGYMTLQGTFAVLQYTQDHNNKLPDLDNGVPGSGLGMYYITPEFAGKIQALNDTVNEGIAQAAQQTGSPLVDIRSIFEGLASGNPSNPYFHLASSINPGLCCTLAFEGGLVSFDGLHPSNTGYALLASAFIKTINQAYHQHIAQIDVEKAYNGKRCQNTSYCFPDPYAPPNGNFAVVHGRPQ